MKSWLYLLCAILLEISGTTCMKLSEGLTRFWPTLFIGLFYITSLAIFTLALKEIDIGTAYGVWAGLGTAAIAAIGFVFFQEPASALKLASLLLIILGVIGLNISGIHR